MSESIIVALIAACIPSAVSLITTVWQHNLTRYRVDQLEKKVDKHNGFEHSIQDLKKDVAVLLEKEAVANHRLSDLEKKAV